jgi:hypothetical protein
MVIFKQILPILRGILFKISTFFLATQSVGHMCFLTRVYGISNTWFIPAIHFEEEMACIHAHVGHVHICYDSPFQFA